MTARKFLFQPRERSLSDRDNNGDTNRQPIPSSERQVQGEQEPTDRIATKERNRIEGKTKIEAQLIPRNYTVGGRGGRAEREKYRSRLSMPATTR